MRHALRRILWIVPTLLAISIPIFWVLSLSEVRAPGARADLPRFFNASPENVRDLSLQAMSRIAAGDSSAASAASELVRLGGAALPHVLPALDVLPPEGRARVAMALAPVARRMGVGSADELDSPDAAVVFWNRFWQERSIDFRAQVAQRLVHRAAQHASALRREDVENLDTFALPDIIDNLGRVTTPDDVARVRRLAALAAHATGNDWRVPRGATLAQAQSVASRWQRWWDLNRGDYITFDGPRRVSAMLVETRYGHWASEAVKNRLGLLTDGRPVLDVMRSQAPVTLWLVLSGLLGGYACGVVWGVLAAAFARSRLEAAASVIAVTLVALPLALVAPWLAPPGTGMGSAVAGALLMLLGAAALVSRYERVAARRTLDAEPARTAAAFGASRVHIALRAIRGSSAAVLGLVAVDVPVLFTMAFVVERALRLHGLAEVTLGAIRSHDVAWLMALALAGVVGAALLQIASDLLLLGLDPRIRSSDARNRGAVE